MAVPQSRRGGRSSAARIGSAESSKQEGSSKTHRRDRRRAMYRGSRDQHRRRGCRRTDRLALSALTRRLGGPPWLTDRSRRWPEPTWSTPSFGHCCAHERIGCSPANLLLQYTGRRSGIPARPSCGVPICRRWRGPSRLSWPARDENVVAQLDAQPQQVTVHLCGHPEQASARLLRGWHRFLPRGCRRRAPARPAASCFVRSQLDPCGPTHRSPPPFPPGSFPGRRLCWKGWRLIIER
jgi:hypothetical protein